MSDDDATPLSPEDEAHVHDLLAALPDPEVPDDVQARIAAALAAPDPAEHATVLPNRRRAAPSSPSGRWRNPRLLQGAAVLVIIALVGAAGWGVVAARSDDGGSPATVAGADSGASATAVITTSGAAYTAANLAPGVRGLLTTGAPSAGGLELKTPDTAATAEGDTASSSGSLSSTQQNAVPGIGALTSLIQDPTSRQACLDQLSGVPGEQALAIDLGTFNAKPAAVIVLPSALDATQVDVWVVGSTCSDKDNPFPYQYQQVPRP